MVNYLNKKTKLLIPILLTIGCYSVVAQNPCNVATPNLITNGNFESCVIGNQANDGFTVDPTDTYVGPTTCAGGGTYYNTTGNWSVTDNAPSLNSAYINPTGTPGSGNPTPNHYLVVNVNGTLNEVDYMTTVNVVGGTTYFFSGWMADINNTFYNPPILNFNINGTQVGSLAKVDSLGNTNGWQQFYIIWQAPLTVNGSITISIENERPTGVGNDLALDNISFVAGCANISNLNSIGKTASLIDTLYECDFSFPQTITSGLPTSGYQFIWKDASYNPLTGTNNQTSYTFSTAPAAGKYYLCYDTIPGCYRADSFIVSNKINVYLGVNQTLCPPIAYTITPSPIPTASGLTYAWKLNGTVIAGATSSTYQAIQTGTYSLTVSSASCGSASSQMTISAPSPMLSGTVSCVGGEYQFTATPGTYNAINGSSSVLWYNTPSGGTAFPSNPNSTSVTVTTANLVSTPGCPVGGLYAQDMDSYYTTLGPTTVPAGTMPTGPTSNGAGYMQITVYETTTLTSLNIVQDNWGTGTVSYGVSILSDNAGSPGTAVFTSATVSTTGVTTPTVLSLPVNYTLPGTVAGTKYWIDITGNEFGILSGTGISFPYSNTPNPGVAQITKQLIYGGSQATQLEAFDLQFTLGTPNPCNRSWVCESAGCATPVKFIYINAETENSATTINWATASEINNNYFIVQKSTDGVHFTNIDTLAGAGNSSTIRTYSYIDPHSNNGTTYYRVEQVDYNKDFTFSDIVTVSSKNTLQVKIYPVPVKSGDDLTIDFISQGKQAITLSVTDVVGKTLAIYLKNAEKGANAFTLPTAHLPQGIYLVELLSQNGEKTVQRIVVN